MGLLHMHMGIWDYCSATTTIVAEIGTKLISQTKQAINLKFSQGLETYFRVGDVRTLQIWFGLV
jgi:D-hexose-6-phosphate mutarotase